MTQNVQDWMRQIQRVARRAAMDWPGIVEEDDLVQEIVVKILESPATVSDLSDMDSDSRYRTLHKIAHRIASEERASYEQFSGDFRYSVGEVQELLEAASYPDAVSVGASWKTGDYTRSGMGHSDPTANIALVNCKVSDARKQLSLALVSLRVSNLRQYEALVSRFLERKIPDRKDTAAFMVIERALSSLTTKMNHGHKREHTRGTFFMVKSRSGRQIRYLDNPSPGESMGDGPGTRQAITNSAARYLSKEGWDADYAPAPSHLRDNHIEPEVWDV